MATAFVNRRYFRHYRSPLWVHPLIGIAPSTSASRSVGRGPSGGTTMILPLLGMRTVSPSEPPATSIVAPRGWRGLNRKRDFIQGGGGLWPAASAALSSKNSKTCLSGVDSDECNRSSFWPRDSKSAVFNFTLVLVFVMLLSFGSCRCPCFWVGKMQMSSP